MKRVLISMLALCLLLTACAPQTEEQEEPATITAEAESGLVVKTDWSQLGEREELPASVGSRWYADYTDHLIPRDDYGTLIPYVGLRLLDDWPAYNGCLYGMMTLDGQVVTDPVYSTVYCPGYGTEQFPLLVLKQNDPSSDTEEDAVYAVAAADGSWCTSFDYREFDANSQGLLLFRADSVTVMSTDGDIQQVWTVAEMGISQTEFDSVISDITWYEGWGGQRRGDYMALGWAAEDDFDDLRCFDLVSGEIRVIPIAEWDAMYDGSFDDSEQALAIPDAFRLTDKLLGRSAPGLLELTEYTEERVTTTFYREDGTPLPDFTLYGERWYEQVSLVGGLIEVLEWDRASYYDLDTLECRFRTYLGYEGD